MASPCPRSCSCSRPMGNAADDSQMVGEAVGVAVTVWVHVEEEGGPVVPTKSPLG